MEEEWLDEFEVGYRGQREWAWLILAAFFLGGIGAGAFLVSTFVGFFGGQVLGFAIVALGKTTAHLLYLGRPDRFWRAFLQPGTSWISRGVILVTLFIVIGLLYLAPSFVTWLPWHTFDPVGQTLLAFALLCAFGVAIYTGFVMAYSPGIASWNTTLLPIMFVVYALLGGTGVVFLALPFAGGAGPSVTQMETIEITLIVAAIIVVSVYALTAFHSTIGAREAVRVLVFGRLRLHFIGGVIGIGLLLPLALSVYALSLTTVDPSSIPPIFVTAGILELAGGLLFRYSLLKAGIYSPLI